MEFLSPNLLFAVFLGFGYLCLHSILTHIQRLFLPEGQRLIIRTKQYKTLFLLNMFQAGDKNVENSELNVKKSFIEFYLSLISLRV
jgi:hypothetical protein